ncbi:MAG: chemotaxis protein CheW [Candidatus Omnitrophota bacterium]
MPQDTESLLQNTTIDPHKLDHLMGLSSELVIIRSQYARTEKLLRHDLSRQKELAQGIARAKALLEIVFKEPARAQKALADLDGVITGLNALSRFDEASGHILSMAHTTSALEKASSDIQSGIAEVRLAASGGKTDASSAMAIIPALLVVVGDEICAFPISAVTEIINVPKKDIYTVDGNMTMKLRDHALSLVELSKVIQAEANAAHDETLKRVVVITDGKDKLGIMVDSLLGKDEIVLKSLTKHYAGVKGIVGASILADGNVALILDPSAIIKCSK